MEGVLKYYTRENRGGLEMSCEKKIRDFMLCEPQRNDFAALCGSTFLKQLNFGFKSETHMLRKMLKLLQDRK